MSQIITPAQLQQWLFDGQEIALFDAWRERIKACPAVQRAYAKGREVAAAERSLVLQ